MKDVQKVAFQEELHALKKNTSIPKSSSLTSLCPVVNSDGVLRVGGRLRNEALPEESHHQCILPGHHHVTRINLSHKHVSKGHIGPEHTLTNLRASYWISNSRTVIKSVLRNCFFCRVWRAVRMYLYMADLPKCHVAYNLPPFTNCGIDPFGPRT